MSEVNADGVLLNPHEAILQEVQALSNALMALPNLACLVLLSGEIAAECGRFPAQKL